MSPSQFVALFQMDDASINQLITLIESPTTRALTVDKTLRPVDVLYVGIYGGVPEERGCTDSLGWMGFDDSIPIECNEMVTLPDNIVYTGDDLKQLSSLLRMRLL